MSRKNWNLNDVGINIKKQLESSASIHDNSVQKIKQKEKDQDMKKTKGLSFLPILSKRIGKLKKTQSFSCYLPSDSSKNDQCQENSIVQDKKNKMQRRSSQTKIKRIGKVNPSRAFNILVLGQHDYKQKYETSPILSQNQQQFLSQQQQQNKIKEELIQNELYQQQANIIKENEKPKQIINKKNLKLNKNLSKNLQTFNKSIQHHNNNKHSHIKKYQNLHGQQKHQLSNPCPKVCQSQSIPENQNLKSLIQQQGSQQNQESEQQNTNQIEYKIIISIVSHKSMEHKQEHQYQYLNQSCTQSQNQGNNIVSPIKSSTTETPRNSQNKKPIINQMKFKKPGSNTQKHKSQYLNASCPKYLNKKIKSKQKISMMSSSLATPDLRNLGTDKVDSSRTFKSCDSKQVITKSISKSIIQQKPHILFKSHPFLDSKKRTKKIKPKRNDRLQKHSQLQRYSVNQLQQKEHQELKAHLEQIKNKKILKKKNSRQLKMHYCLKAAKQHLQKQQKHI